MKLAIMQPYFFPYIGYWQLINAVDTFVIYDDVTFIKQGYINRNSILLDGKSKQFTLELIGASSNKLINEIKVGNNCKKLLKTIKINYNKAQYFDIVFPLIENILTQDEKNLAKFIGYSLKQISNYLNIDTKFIYSSHIEKDNNLKAQDKVLAINKVMKSNTYINSIGGVDLYNKKDFSNLNINLIFLESEIPKYKQFNNDFIPYLSIIDIMMFNSVEGIQNMLNSYELV